MRDFPGKYAVKPWPRSNRTRAGSALFRRCACPSDGEADFATGAVGGRVLCVCVLQLVLWGLNTSGKRSFYSFYVVCSRNTGHHVPAPPPKTRSAVLLFVGYFLTSSRYFGDMFWF